MIRASSTARWQMLKCGRTRPCCTCRCTSPAFLTRFQPTRDVEDKEAYDAQAQMLAHLFAENFKNYADLVSEEVLAAGPTVAAK